MKKFFLISIILIFLFQSRILQAQSRFSFGPEIGINTSGRISSKTYEDSYPNIDTETIKFRPIVSPLIGAWTKYNLNKHFNISLGIQYLKSGEKYNRISDGYHLFSPLQYHINTTTNSIYEKLSIPIELGFDFKIKNARANIFVAYVFNFYVSGNYYFKETRVDDDTTSNLSNYSVELKMNPCNKTEATTANQNKIEGKIGAGFYLTQSLNLSFIYSTKTEFTFAENNIPPYSWGDEYFHFLNYRDVSIALKYSFDIK